ncbi:MAG: TonB-dependent receptor [Bacteroidota bacterium]
MTLPPRLPALLSTYALAALTVLLGPAAWAQSTADVSGRVVEAATGDPLVGATVAVEAMPQSGTVTDADGRFRIAVPEGAATLVVRSLGYETERLRVTAGETDLRIALAYAPVEIEGIEVLAARTREYERLPGTATLLSAAEVRQIQPIGTQELLEYVPGVYGAADDGIGNARLSIGIRGLNPRRSSRVLVLEDGIPIQPALYVYPNMYYNPPVERIERVEVIKGSAAVRYGPQTMGGVINYITSRPRSTFGGAGHLTVGQNGYVSAFAEAGGFGTRGFVPEVQFLAKRGDGFRENNGFYQLNATAKATIRTGPQSTLFLKANGNLETYEATYTGLTEFSFDDDPEFNPKDDDEFFVRRASLDAIYNRSLSADVSSLTRAYVSVFDRRWWRENDVFIRSADLDAYNEDPSSVSFVAPFSIDEDSDVVRVGNGRDNFGILRTFYAAGVEHAYTWSHTLFGGESELEAGARLHVERFIDDRVLGDSPGAREGVYTQTDPDTEEEIVASNPSAGVVAKAQNYETAAVALFASERLRFGALEVTPGLRLEVFEQERVDRLQGSILDDKTTVVLLPGLGLNYQVGASNLFAGIHRGFTPPSSGALTIVDFGNTIEDGGLDVEAEKSWNVEAGFRVASPLLAAEVAGFYLYIDDLVAAGRGTAFRNLGSAQTYGAEVAATVRGARFGPLPDLHLSYTFLQTEVLDGLIPSAVVNNVSAVAIDGNELPYAPAHNLTVGLSRTVRGVTARADLRFVSEVFTDFENLDFATGRGETGPVPSYALLNASVRVPIGERLTAQMTVKNALDEVYVGSRLHSNPRQVTANQSSGILPGTRRQVNLGVRYTF